MNDSFLHFIPLIPSKCSNRWSFGTASSQLYQYTFPCSWTNYILLCQMDFWYFLLGSSGGFNMIMQLDIYVDQTHGIMIM